MSVGGCALAAIASAPACWHHKALITSLTIITPVVYQILQHYMFNMESRHLLNKSIQNALNCISENFNLKNFPGGGYARTSLEKCAVRCPDGGYRAHIASVYYISRPPLWQNSPSAPCQAWFLFRFVLFYFLFIALFFFFLLQFWSFRFTSFYNSYASLTLSQRYQNVS